MCGDRTSAKTSGSGIALGNLRAVVILIVLAFHSVLAYLASLPAPASRFDSPPYTWQAFPIVDSQRWFGFDLFCAWQDLSLMSLMFFLSGLFVAPSLRRKGSRTFLTNRFVRIGIPFLLGVMLLMPVAFYPTYRVTAADPSLGAYWQHWRALPFWPNGPQWFLWQLLALDILAAGLHRFGARGGKLIRRLVASGRDHPLRCFVALAVASALGYVPLALAFSPWTWWNFGIFAIQLSRPLHYVVYFFAGVAIGAEELDRGLVACDGALARRWPIWLAAAVAAFALWAAPTAVLLQAGDRASLALRFAVAVGFVLACAAGCFAMLATLLHFAQKRVRPLESLSNNAYGMYLVHYVFVIWLQYALLDIGLLAITKAAIVFGGTVALSWSLASALRSVRLGALLIGQDRRALDA